MSTRSERWRRLKAVLGYAAVQALALTFAGLIALTLHGPWARGARAQAAVPPPMPAAAPAAPGAQFPAPSELDSLRSEATLGDMEAGRMLVGTLLDRYDRAGDTDDLFEAVQWMDRAWAAGYYQQSGLATRVFERHCGNRVLRWHWLCDRGE